MRTKLWLVFFLTVFLTGCATSRKSQHMQTQQFQSRINSLEVELKLKDETIKTLEAELETTRNELLSSYRQKDSHVASLSARQIQIALKNAGFYKGPIDGKIGPQTKEAIKAFQKANGLKVDGVVGKQTIEKMRDYLD